MVAGRKLLSWYYNLLLDFDISKNTQAFQCQVSEYWCLTDQTLSDTDQNKHHATPVSVSLVICTSWWAVAVLLLWVFFFFVKVGGCCGQGLFERMEEQWSGYFARWPNWSQNTPPPQTQHECEVVYLNKDPSCLGSCNNRSVRVQN